MLFSIVTPSFRQLAWLRLCVASVADQVHRSRVGLRVEHLVQDAGTPGILELARELEQRSAGAAAAAPGGLGYRLEVHVEPDRGMYDAINRGFRRAEGQVFAYLNCDEQYLPWILEKVATHFAEHPHTEVLFAGAIVVDAAGSYLCDRLPTLPTRSHTLVSGNLAFFTSSTFFRASVLRERALWFDASWRAMGDAEWALRLIEAGVHMDTVAWPASVHTDTGENLALSDGAVAERSRLARMAESWLRAARPLVVGAHRLRKLAHGAYDPKPHSYRIYTRENPERRTAFTVESPSWRWR